MKYHIVSTSASGQGAVFTDAGEARAYHRAHPGSLYQVLDKMPSRIPPVNAPEKKGRNANLSVDPGSPITVYTDGSSLGNPGPGGYGVVIRVGEKTRELSQGYVHTTNNRMEMMAVITALETLGEYRDHPVTIHSDSQYTINGITKGWARGWRKRGWKKADGKPALNPDLWKILLGLTEGFSKLEFRWVKGHAGNPLNERADELANSSAGGDDLVLDKGYQR